MRRCSESESSGRGRIDRIMFKTRTAGDGSDSSKLIGERSREIVRAVIEKQKSKYGLSRFRDIQCFFDHESPVDHLPEMILVQSRNPLNVDRKSNFRSKVAKFVPIEPYTACILPVEINERNQKPVLTKNDCNLIRKVPNSTNVQIDDLVHEISKIRCQEMNDSSSFGESKDNGTENTEKSPLDETELDRLRESNKLLEVQLQYQIQVNNELKTLLIASLGEDIETKVNTLTEDRLQLAKALLNSTNCLSSHRESIEWLTGQCEVWRSKFLASSLMVEELSKWKTLLESKQKNAEVVFSDILDEYEVLFNGLHRIFENLNSCDLNTTNSNGAHNQNVLELVGNCQILSERFENSSKSVTSSTLTKSCTNSEIAAIKHIEDSKNSIKKPINELFEALINEAAKYKDNTNRYRPVHLPSNCGSCKGVVEDV